METDLYFQSFDKLPNVLSKEETTFYFKKYRNGDKEAREILITHNIQYVIYVVKSILTKGIYNCSKSDLISTGLIGLIKAVDSFDVDKNISFLTYADKCIRNEINMFFRKNKKHQKDSSLEALVLNDTLEDVETSYEKFLCDKQVNIEEKYIDDDIISQLRIIISSLPEREQKILTMYFGLGNRTVCTQQEIAEQLNVSQSYLSRKIKQILELLRTLCLMKGIIEYNSRLFEEEKRTRKCKVKEA